MNFSMKLLAILFLSAALPGFGENAPLKMFPVDKNIFCVRAPDISENFSGQFSAAAPPAGMAALVLDLRLAGGADETNAADFLAAKKIPLVVLTDAQTRGAAAALAEKLHAGGAVIIATGMTAAEKTACDLRVPLGTEEEKRFLANPYTNAVATSGLASATNLAFYVDHTSEAELVRKRVKDSEEDGAGIPRATPPAPVIRDPALARAVDLLKALAVWRKPRG
jgi:hypothetical protein